MNNSEINAIIAFLLLFAPFGYICFKAYRHFKDRLTTKLSIWVFTLISLVCFFAYFYLTFWLGYYIDGRIGDSMAMASFAAFVFSVYGFIIVFIGILILTISYYIRKSSKAE
mgnify:FL=1